MVRVYRFHTGISKRNGRHPDYDGLSHHGSKLRDGKKHARRQRAHFQRGTAFHHTVRRIHNLLAVPAAFFRFDLNIDIKALLLNTASSRAILFLLPGGFGTFIRLILPMPGAL